MSQSILEKSKYVNLIVSTAAKNKDRYILVQEAKPEVKGLWNFPSGKVHVDEDLIKAAKREFLEETGYDVKIEKLISIYHYAWDDNKGISIRFNFSGSVTDKGGKQLAKDVLRAEWKTLDEIKKLGRENKLRVASTYRMVEDIASNKETSLDALYTNSKPME